MAVFPAQHCGPAAQSPHLSTDVQCDGLVEWHEVTYLQLGQLPLCSSALLGGKVAGLYSLVQVQLGALKCLVHCLQLPLQACHLRKQ